MTAIMTPPQNPMALGQIATFDGIPFVWVQIHDYLAGWVPQENAPNPPTYTGFGPDPNPYHFSWNYSPYLYPTIPEPSGFALLAVGLLVLARWRRRIE